MHTSAKFKGRAKKKYAFCARVQARKALASCSTIVLETLINRQSGRVDCIHPVTVM